jgi:hypothetical protein
VAAATDLAARARAAFDERCFVRAAELCEVGLNRLPPPELAETLRALRDEARALIDPPPAGDVPPPPIFWQGIEVFATGAYRESVVLFRRALAETPNSAQVRAQLGMALIGAGEFTEGFAHYEARRRLGWGGTRTMIAPWWDGQPMPGKTLLLWDEQGNGDAIQFVRFARVAASRSRARVIFHGRPRLCRLFRRCPGIAESLSRAGPFPSPDAHVSLVSLPAVLGSETTDLGEAVPYLSAEPALVEAWRERLGARVRPRIGLFWQGSPGFHDDRRRSFPLATYFPLLRRFRDRVDFYSLQKGTGEEQVADLPPDLALPHLGPTLDGGEDGFVETAAVLSQLDLLITSDSAITHLGGALGRPVWMLLGHGAEWRWGESHTTTPFYPTMKLFRRSEGEPWSAVAARVGDALLQLLDEGGQS